MLRSESVDYVLIDDTAKAASGVRMARIDRINDRSFRMERSYDALLLYDLFYGVREGEVARW